MEKIAILGEFGINQIYDPRTIHIKQSQLYSKLYQKLLDIA